MPRTALRQPVRMSGELTARIMFAGRSSSMSAQIVAWVRDALFAKKLKPGDFLGAEKATDADIAKLRALLRQAEESIGDLDAFTRLSRDFHLAVAEASHNRVLVVQLISLEHVSWPRRNVTATPKLARHILDIHTKLTDLIELRDAAGARALMDDHVKMIRARRVAERDHGHETTCC